MPQGDDVFADPRRASADLYDRPPGDWAIIKELNVPVRMRDGICLFVDVYRPDVRAQCPALLAMGIHPKEFQGIGHGPTLPPQPAWSSLWTGHLEAGDTQYFVTRGYSHIIASPRGVGLNDDGGSREWDSYDLIEWLAAQVWCNAQVGMVGFGAYAAEQLHAAKQRAPHLKAIFAFDPRGALGKLGGFREECPGGVLHLFRYYVDHFSAAHLTRGAPSELVPQKKAWWGEAMANPDLAMYPHIRNVLNQKGQHMPRFFELLLDPYDHEDIVQEAEAAAKAISVPSYLGAGWYGYTYKTHLNGAQNYFALIAAPKKLLFAGPAHLDRPVRAFRSESLRWYDHWLKQIDSGVMNEPSVKYWLMGANEWRHANEWPPRDQRWVTMYLNSWERLTTDAHLPSSTDSDQPPDVFVQMPPTQTNSISRLRYVSEPLTREVVVVGSVVLYLYAAIDQSDTNWIVILSDLGPDGSVLSAREGERALREDIVEREITRGWLKASLRALDPQRSSLTKPWHKLTRESRAPVRPGEIELYVIEFMATANLFKPDHRICLDITSLDLPSGVAGATNIEYVPNHICSSETTVHRIFHDEKRPSKLVLPVIQ